MAQRRRLLLPASNDFVVDDRTPLHVEFDEVGSELPDAEQSERSSQAVNHALNQVRVLSHRLSAAIESMNPTPAELEVNFGIRLQADGKASIVSDSDRASLQVRLKWHPQTLTAEPYHEPTSWEDQFPSFQQEDDRSRRQESSLDEEDEWEEAQLSQRIWEGEVPDEGWDDFEEDELELDDDDFEEDDEEELVDSEEESEPWRDRFRSSWRKRNPGWF